MIQRIPFLCLEMFHTSLPVQVLKVPLSSIGRRWEVKSSELAQEVALTVKREAYASFRADPDFAYIVVPYPG